ncbi:MAG: hypothetical protein R3F36_05670 [Candidatus Competibacteraceae bacterium]
MDEREGRRVARRFGLKTVGVVGVLIEAKARGLIAGRAVAGATGVKRPAFSQATG